MALTVISAIIFRIDARRGMAAALLTAIAIVIRRYNTPYYIKNSEKLSGQKLYLFNWIGGALRESGQYGVSTRRNMKRRRWKARALVVQSGRRIKCYRYVRRLYWL
jgi:hypothetical protein